MCGTALHSSLAQVVIAVAEGGALAVTQAMFATSFQQPPQGDDSDDAQAGGSDGAIHACGSVFE